MLRTPCEAITLVGMNDVASEQTEEELIQHVARGNSEAFAMLYRRLAPRVLSLISARLRPPLSAEDIAQETWKAVFRKANKYESGDGKVISWIFTIAVNQSIDAMRKLKRRPEGALEFDPDGQGAESPSAHSNPKLDALKSCIEEIESDFVQVIRLRLSGLASQEIAERLRISTPTVDTRASRGKIQLKACVERKLK